MGSPKRRRPSGHNARALRERLRKQGQRPIEIWVADVRSPAFRAAAHRQSRAVATSRFAERDQAFIEAVTLPLRDDG